MNEDVSLTYDIISTTSSDYIVINNDEEAPDDDIQLHTYSYPHDRYSGDELDLPESITPVPDDFLFGEVKPAMSVEDELNQRLRELQEEQAQKADNDKRSNDTVPDSGLDEDYLDELRNVGDKELYSTELDDVATPTGETPTPMGSTTMLDQVGVDDTKHDDLMLAVKNDAPHLIDDLINKSNPIRMYMALIFSISLGRDHITKMFLDHHKYETLQKITRLCRLGALHTLHTEGEEGEDSQDEGKIDSDITPLMLAALKHQFEITQKFISKGETVDEPHALGCKCEDCLQQTDELKTAKSRLNTYRALSSDAYIVLGNADPILRSFELRQKFQELAVEEKHYKAEYLQLANHCGELSSRILNQVHDGDELDKLLNERSGSGASSRATLARLKLAIRNEEKQFVAHPVCQKALMSLWVGNLNSAWVSSPARGLAFFCILTILYPFLVIGYWIYPKKKLEEFLQTPLVKFCSNIGSYLVFVSILLALSATEEVSAGYKLSEDPQMGLNYLGYLNTTSSVLIQDVDVRFHAVRVPIILLVVWLLGMIWDALKKINFERAKYFTDNMFNLMTFLKLCLYIVSFTFRFYAIIMVQSSITYFSRQQSWDALSENDTAAVDHMYWLDADRRTWTAADPTIISEATFGIASIFSICKITYTFTISERIGPLLLSLGKMLEDVFAFMVIFVFIIAAFCVGFHNLYWYFYASETLQNQPDPSSSFDSVGKVIELFFWSIFGLVEFGSEIFDTVVEGQVTSLTGLILFAIYNWMMVIILINMLIAMMSRSYEIIAEYEDVEWKYARTKMFLEYMRKDSTLPTPFNILPTWKGIYLLHKRFADNWCYVMAGRIPPKKRKKMRMEAELQAKEGKTNSVDSNGLKPLPSTEEIELQITAKQDENDRNDGNDGSGGNSNKNEETEMQETPTNDDTEPDSPAQNDPAMKKRPSVTFAPASVLGEDEIIEETNQKREEPEGEPESSPENTDGKSKKKSKKSKSKKKKSKKSKKSDLNQESGDEDQEMTDGEKSESKKKSKTKKSKSKKKKKKGDETVEEDQEMTDVDKDESKKKSKTKKSKSKKKKRDKSIEDDQEMTDTDQKDPKKKSKSKKPKSKAKKKKLGGKGPSDAYMVVIGEVVKRFTHKGGGGDDIDAGDGIEQLQQDLSTLRRDMMQNIFRQDREMAKMAEDIFKVDNDVHKSQEAFTQQHKHLKQENEKRVVEMKINMDELDQHLQRILENLTQRLNGIQGSLTDQIQDTQKHVDQRIEGVKTDINVINNGIVKQNESVNKIQGTLMQQVEDVSTMHGTLSELCTDVNTVQGTLSKSVIMRASTIPEEEEGAEGTDEGASTSKDTETDPAPAGAEKPEEAS